MSTATLLVEAAVPPVDPDDPKAFIERMPSLLDQTIDTAVAEFEQWADEHPAAEIEDADQASADIGSDVAERLGFPNGSDEFDWIVSATADRCGELFPSPLDEAQDPDPDDVDFDPARYVDDLTVDGQLRRAGFAYQDKGIPYWYKVRQKQLLQIRQNDYDAPGVLQKAVYILVGGKWEQQGVPEYVPLSELPSLIKLYEAQDPDEFDPHDYIEQVRPAYGWILVWRNPAWQNPSYYEARTARNVLGRVVVQPGGTWRQRKQEATRFKSQEDAQEYWQRNRSGAYGDQVQVEPLYDLNEAEENPDDPVNFLRGYRPVCPNCGRSDARFYVRKLKSDTGRVVSEIPVWQCSCGQCWRTDTGARWWPPDTSRGRLREDQDPDDFDPYAYIKQVEPVWDKEALERDLEKAFRRSFMQPEYWEGTYHVVTTRVGDYIVPSDVVDSDDPDDYGDYVEGRVVELSERKQGWLYRVQAPGYLDASEWSVANTEEEAIEALIEMGDEGEMGEPDELDEAQDPDDFDPMDYIHDLKLSVDRINEVLATLPKDFQIGFSVDTSDQRMIEENAEEHGIVLGPEQWETLNEDIVKMEDAALAWLQTTVTARGEGHSGYAGSYVGSAWFDLANPRHFALFHQWMLHEEGWSTSSGTLPDEAKIYDGTSELAGLVDVSINLFDYAEMQAAYERLEDAGISLDEIVKAWQGTTPPRRVAETYDPDAPDMARWVERISAESLLDQAFGRGMDYLRDEPGAATEWFAHYQFGEWNAYIFYTIFYKGERAPSSIYKYEYGNGKWKTDNSEILHGPGPILKQVEKLVFNLQLLKSEPKPARVDIHRLLDEPVRYAYGMERYGEEG